MDIFFVISGYLISSLVFGSLQNDTFSISRFYARRIRRLFPALIVVLASSLILGWYVLTPDEFRQLGKHVIASAAYVQNFILWEESGYFEGDAETKPLLHIWSLAVEEQFYIFWPLLLVFTWKQRWNFLTLTAVVFAVSFAANLYLVANDPVAAYYSPVARFWELMVGGALAYIVMYKRELVEKRQEARSVLGFALIGLGLVFIDRNRDFPGWWAVLPVAGALLIISAGPYAWLNAKILSCKPLVWLGLISYPLYLWHWSLLSFAKIIKFDSPSREEKVLLIAVAIVLAALTYELIERPIRFKVRSAAVPLACTSFALLLCGVLTYSAVVSPRNDIDPAVFAAMTDWTYPKGLKRREGQTVDIYERGDGEDVTLFIGDSSLEQYGPRVVHLLSAPASRLNKAVFITHGGCPPIPNVLEDHPNHRGCAATIARAIEAARRPEVNKVVIGACWNCYFASANGREEVGIYSYYHQDGDIKRSLLAPGGVDGALEELEALLLQLGGDRIVYLMLDTPTGEVFNPKAYIGGSRLGALFVRPIPAFVPYDSLQVSLRSRLSAIAARAGAVVIDPVSHLCNGSLCPATTADGVPIYKDGEHLRSSYVSSSASFIDVALVAGAQQP